MLNDKKLKLIFKNVIYETGLPCLRNIFFALLLRGQNNNIALTESLIPIEFKINQVNRDSSNPIRIINGSSLKRLPAVIRDLSTAFNGSIFQEGPLLDKKGFAVYIYDGTFKSIKESAAVEYPRGDTIYHMKLNSFNQYASDKALAVTLIHEIMHCILLDINKRARENDERALSSIKNFGLNRNDTSGFFYNDFFFIMNDGNSGQHELMYRLFYPHMVSLLNRFAMLQKESLFNQYSEKLMWSGLQKTDAYLELSDEEREEIETAIFTEKGLNIQ